MRLRAWDGSEAGPVDAPLVVLRSRDAVRRLLWNPGELGAAQAYVTGEIDVDGDLDDALTHVWAVAAARGLSGVRPSARPSPRRCAPPSTSARSAAAAPPASQARLRGRLHSKLRDRRAISHHYDLCNEFYSLILDPQMAYSSATSAPTTRTTPRGRPARQARPGLPASSASSPACASSTSAAAGARSRCTPPQHYGAKVTGVTIAAEQKKFIDARIGERGLEDLVEIRLQDYREIPESRGPAFDAVASLEMGEHVGEQNYATYAQVLHDAVKPGGRVLIQQMSRSGGRKPPRRRPVHRVVHRPRHAHASGRRDRRLHRARWPRGARRARYARALRVDRRRLVGELRGQLGRLTELVGEEVVRVWRLYLVGGAMVFRDGRMGVDQILVVKPGGRAHPAAGADF